MRGQVLSLAVVLAGTLLLPLGLRAVNMALPGADVRDSFVPSLEPPRQREPFDQATADLLRQVQPQVVLVGDSMAGVRVNPGYLSRLTGRPSAGLFLAGSPVAYWYLEFKNFVVNNELRQVRKVLFFFRDDQLTRQVTVSSLQLDHVARDVEPELDRVIAANRFGPFWAVHRSAQAAYGFDRTRVWGEPRLLKAPADLIVSAGKAPADLIDRMNSEVFGLDKLRHFEATDFAAADDGQLRFDAQVGSSLLPDIVALAERAKIHVGFICVQRRPTPDGPPSRSPALVRYLHDLKRYLDAHGAYFYDEWGDPRQTLSVYADGDHLRPDQKDRYTEQMARQHAAFFQ